SEADVRPGDIIPFHGPIAPSWTGWHESCFVSARTVDFQSIKASNALFLKIQAATAPAYRRGGGKAWPSIATRRQIIAARTRQLPIEEFNMSLSAIPTSLSATLSAANFHPRGHHRGAHVDTGVAGSGAGLGSGSVGSVGQLPVGATTGLFSSLLQSLEQV